MPVREIEKPLAWLLAVGTVFITCFVWTGSGTDPVNAPKMLALGAMSFGVLGIILKFGIKTLWTDSRLFLTLNLAFISLSVSSTIFSNSPFTQNLYGAYGRNTGLLTYFSLAIISLGATLVRSQESFLKFSRAIIVAGVLNVIYCLWVLIFGDPIPWNNTYKNILGLLGNPNFISAFLGIVASAGLAYSLKPRSKIKSRILYVSLLLACVFLIFESHSIQGIFVTLAGSAAVVFFFLRDKFKSVFLHFGYLILVATGGIFAISGMLQHGPLSFIYKKSVSLRGAYWDAGIEMGQSHPFTGVGLDSYGDWYRSARPPVALVDTPGPTVLSNASHNVAIDLFASGGFPLLIVYLGMIILGIKSILNLVRIHKKYDLITVVLVSTWLGYHAQSIVSINQIGLAVWGWAVTGLLIAYEKVSKRENVAKELSPSQSFSRKKKTGPQVVSPQLVIGLGLVVGSIISVPPMSSDARWFVATQTSDLNSFKSALVDDYLHPINSPRLANAAVILQNSNLLSEAREYALMGIKFNPDYFESYLVLYGLPNSSESEKKFAMDNMKRLDPNNPNVLNYK